ncbi:MAG: fibronectin type III domain-containing protein [Rubrivivax sp.]
MSTVFTLRKSDNSTETVTLPRHRCGIVLKSDADRRAMMDEIMKTMAGRHGWAGGVWRMRAGTMASSVFAVDTSWIVQLLNEDGEPASSDEPVLRISNGVARENRVTRVTGKCIHPAERWQPLPFPAVQDATRIAADGGIPMPLEVSFEGVNHPAHAQHLASLLIRQAAAGLRMQLRCNLNAFRCELFDVGTVTLDRFGMSAKTFEVLGWRWHPGEGVQLELAEIASAMFTPLAELKGIDPAPDSNLPPPWDVQAITGLSVASGTADLADSSSILARVRVSWDAVTQGSVRAGGQVEVQYVEVTALAGGNWASWVETGSATSAVIPGLKSGVHYAFRARAIQALPLVRGPWSALVVAAPVVTAGTAAIGGGNLLRNSSFEVDSDANGLADSWLNYTSGTAGTVTYSQQTGGLTGGSTSA